MKGKRGENWLECIKITNWKTRNGVMKKMMEISTEFQKGIMPNC
jgi:hypothetical protein